MARSVTPPQFTLGDALKFILRHRKGKVFRDWSVRSILSELISANWAGALHVAIEDNKITGVVIAYVNANHLHVSHILCTTRAAFKTFLAARQAVHGALPIHYERRGAKRTLNLPA